MSGHATPPAAADPSAPLTVACPQPTLAGRAHPTAHELCPADGAAPDNRGTRTCGRSSLEMPTRGGGDLSIPEAAASLRDPMAWTVWDDNWVNGRTDEAGMDHGSQALTPTSSWNAVHAAHPQPGSGTASMSGNAHLLVVVTCAIDGPTASVTVPV